jgi:hypothetical protein
VSGGGNRGYKRSWKNLLINKRYQLRFTLFMAGLSAVLMTLLGLWVTRVAGEATNVAKSRQRGRICVSVPEEKPAPAAVAPTPTPTPTPSAPVQVDVGEMKPDVVPPPAGPPGAGAPEPPEGRHRVVIGESSMTIDPSTAPPAPPKVPRMSAEQRAKLVAERDTCEKDIARQIAKIEAANRNIVIVLVVAGVLLTLGLAVFGIKMTHKVAGPLHKVTLYLAKMRDGRYDTVYNLRKGDQLVEFYEHFKHAHAGVTQIEKEDIARIKAALDALEADGVLVRSADARTAADALRKVLERKEASFV